QSGVGAFEFGNPLFRGGMGRIAVPRIEHVGADRASLLIGVGDLDGRSLINRLFHRAIAFVEAGASVNCFRFRTKTMLCHTALLGDHEMVTLRLVASKRRSEWREHC